jgi:hypothetical protein
MESLTTSKKTSPSKCHAVMHTRPITGYAMSSLSKLVKCVEHIRTNYEHAYNDQDQDRKGRVNTTSPHIAGVVNNRQKVSVSAHTTRYTSIV